MLIILKHLQMQTWGFIVSYKHTFSTASRDALFLPLEKNSVLALAHGTLSAPVRAGICSSPPTGGLSSSSIFWNDL
jgi:hypothetical protein